MIYGSKICKEINGSRILTDIDIAVEPGCATVLVGPNGAGKSVLLRALSLVDPPSSGRVRIDDKEYSFPEAHQSAITPPWPNLGIVFQQLFLWPHLTLGDNIKLPWRKRAKRSRHRLEELIDLFQMRSALNRYPNEASLGEKQLAALIRTMVLQPQYLFLDEPTSSLDVEQTDRLLDHLRALKKQNVAILCITHLLGFAERVADNIVFLNEGIVAESGDVASLRKPRTERVARFLALAESSHK